MAITSQEAAEILFNCATLLEMAGANPYRIAAYRNAARVMLQLGDLAPRVVVNDEAMRGLHFGKRLTRKLRELFAENHMTFYDELLAELPLPVARLMTVPGVGPKTALRLYNELGISSPKALAAAAGAGEIRKVHGFGPRREARWATAGAVAERPADLPKAA
ncbi:MAG TPA: helix-hairpin-helix domain-containing protein [Chloroflexia bacterium]|jgi:DNA polymerase (family 10)|nr:helix-hairpin-helix domain-containing protein [Chloroflexia bacterium]